MQQIDFKQISSPVIIRQSKLTVMTAVYENFTIVRVCWLVVGEQISSILSWVKCLRKSF